MASINTMASRERKAKKLYEESTSNDPVIHCNRFPAWSELSASDRRPWLKKVASAESKGRAKR